MPKQSAALDVRERRSSARQVLPGAVLIPVDIDAEGVGFVLDLSDGGASVHSLSRMAPGSMHRLRWKFRGEEPGIEVRGRVIWTDPINLTGLQFTDLEAEVGIQLRRWLRECDSQSKSGAGSVGNPDDRVVADLELGSLLRRAQSLSHADGALVAIRFRDQWVCQASVGIAPEVGFGLLAEAVLCEQCIGTGQPVHCADSSRDPRLRLAGRSFASVILVPVQRGEQGIGVVECLWAQPHSCDEPAIAMLSVVAELVSVAMRSFTVEHLLGEQTRVQDVSNAPSIHENNTAAPDQRLETFRLEAQLGSNHVEQELGVLLQAATPATFLRLGGFNRISLVVLVFMAALVIGWYGGRNWNLLRPEHALPIASSIPAFRAPAAPAIAATGAIAHRKASTTAAVPTRGTKASTLVSTDRASVSLPGNARQGDSTAELGRSTAEDVVAPPTLEMIREAGAGSSVSDLAKRIATTTPVIAPSPQRISSVSPPVALNRVQPEYPATALSMRRRGEVVLDVTVSKEGKVQDVVVVSGDPMLAAAAAKAMPLWRYKPAQLNGDAIEGRVRVTFNFTTPGAP